MSQKFPFNKISVIKGFLSHEQEKQTLLHWYLAGDYKSKVSKIISPNSLDIQQLKAYLAMEEKRRQLVLSPPHSLDPRADNEKHKSMFEIILEIIKCLKPGADLTQFQVPVILNIPKSYLQIITEPIYCFGQDLLSACAYGSNPMQRFLRVVAWHISTTRPLPYAQSPFNPILGEIHHVSSGSLNLIAEQVSHHPPISAIYATDEVHNIRFNGWGMVVAHFFGNKAEATFPGERTLWLDSYNERYEMTCPKLITRILPVTGNEWVGAVTVRCISSGLKATLNFKPKGLYGLRGSAGHISGKIMDTINNKDLFEISGQWNKVVLIKDIKTEQTSVLMDAQAALTNLKPLRVAKEQDLDARESVVVWRDTMEGLVRRDWDMARKAKQVIEDQQRLSAKQRKQEGKTWLPRHFVHVENDQDQWRWRHVGENVPPAPLTVQQ